MEEWIELYDNSPVTIDLSGWTIVDNNGGGGTYTFPDGETIAPGSYYTIAFDSVGFNALYGYDADIYGSFSSLNNSGDALVLEDRYGNGMDAVAWEGGSTGDVPTGWAGTLPS